MKSYTITVNGIAYDVTVEEGSRKGMKAAASAVPVQPAPAAPVRPAAPAPSPAPAPAVKPQPVSAPAPAPAPVPAPAAKPAEAPVQNKAAGSIRLEAGAAGKVFKIEKNVGDSVNAGDTVIVLEAMKMEIPMVSVKAGTVASIDCAVGDMVETGALLATLN